MSEYCEYPLCKRIASRDKFCFLHAVHFAGAKPDKVKKEIPKVSEKRKDVNKQYRKIVKQMLKENALCELKQIGCTKIAEGLHHKQKRLPSNITNPDNLMRACNSCNTWVENHPLEAIELGFTISKHKKLKSA